MGREGGGPAFPFSTDRNDYEGMTWLDYAAIQIASANGPTEEDWQRAAALDATPDHDLVARFSYDAAEALLAEKRRRER